MSDALNVCSCIPLYQRWYSELDSVEFGYFPVKDEVVGASPTIPAYGDVAQLVERVNTEFVCSSNSLYQ